MKDLIQLLKCHGVEDFKWGNNKELATSLARFEKPDDPFFGRVVSTLTVCCMQEAVYFCTGMAEQDKWAHYGLAMSHYTHFTSPIRRYADCLVHRFLAASLKQSPLPSPLNDKAGLNDQVAKLNFKHKMAQHASRTSVDLNIFLYLKARGAVEAVGVVTRVIKAGISVAVEEYGAEGIAEMTPADWVIIQDRQTVHGRPLSKFEGMTVGVFDRVMVRIEAEKQDGKHRKLRFTVIGIPNSKPQFAERNQVPEMVVP
eukprot:UN0691